MTTTRPGLTEAELRTLDGYWRAANYLSAGQIYLMANPLLRQPLRPEDIKPRLLGHWGTTPGLNLLYAHLNRVIRNWDLDMIFVAGPPQGRGRPAGGGDLPGAPGPDRRRRTTPSAILDGPAGARHWQREIRAARVAPRDGTGPEPGR